MMELPVQIGSLRMRNPVLVASGTFGYGPEYADLVDIDRLGAIVVKGIAMEPTTGNPTDRTFEVESGLINAIGLPNPGFQGFVDQYMPFLRQHEVPVIVNIWGRTIEDYEQVAAAFDGVEGVHGLELNVSCPNIKEGSAMFGTCEETFRRVVRGVRQQTKLPLIPKLAPNVTDIRVFARAAEECGADAISLINSIPAMAIDIETRRPRIANVTGGLTGPAIRPIALKLVRDAASAVSIPVIGMGGIATASDALEFMIAGASAVAVGTANFACPNTAMDVIDGIFGYFYDHGLCAIPELCGTLRT